MQPRKTNIDIDTLAQSRLVRAFMLRVIDDLRDPLTGHVFAVTLAKAAADAFDLYCDDGKSFANSLIAAAAHVVALSNACARFEQ